MSLFYSTPRPLALLASAALMATAACDDDDPMTPAGPTTFEVRIENVSTEYGLISSGAFDTPVGEAAPGPAPSGAAYEATFVAGAGDRLHFATMFVQSNDLFYAPDGDGIALFDGGAPVTGDVTDQVMLWDAGTEADEEPGVGANQAPRQSGADTGDADADNTVRLATDASGNIDPVDETIEVTLTYLGDYRFTLRIENVASDMSTSAGDVPVLIAPGVYAVGPSADALFEEGSPNSGDGLEALAEDGDVSGLAAVLESDTGVTSPLAPGAWAVHTSPGPLFMSGAPEGGSGLEALAEDGDPSGLAATLSGTMGGRVERRLQHPRGGLGSGTPVPRGKLHLRSHGRAG